MRWRSAGAPSLASERVAGSVRTAWCLMSGSRTPPATSSTAPAGCRWRTPCAPPSMPLDPWRTLWPLVVVESEASAEVLRPVAVEYRIMIAPLRGQAGRSYLANKVAPATYDGQIVLAVVDLDKVGADIFASTQKRLEEFTGYTFDWRHLALTDDQVDLYGIGACPGATSRGRHRAPGRRDGGPRRRQPAPDRGRRPRCPAASRWPRFRPLSGNRPSGVALMTTVGWQAVSDTAHLGHPPGNT